MTGEVRVLLVTDPKWSDDHIAMVVEAAAAVLVSAFAVQLRDRSERPDLALLPLARRLREITARHGALFVVNRRLDLAALANADGVHADPAAAGSPGWKGWRSAPAHTDEDVQNACIAGLDAVLVSPIFATPGKGPPRGTSALRSARRIAADGVRPSGAQPLAILALGGVDASNARACREAGATGVAVMRALLDAPDAAAAAAAARALSGADDL